MVRFSIKSCDCFFDLIGAKRVKEMRLESDGNR